MYEQNMDGEIVDVKGVLAKKDGANWITISSYKVVKKAQEAPKTDDPLEVNDTGALPLEW